MATSGIDVLPVPTSWAGHRTYASRALLLPHTIEELSEILSSGEQVRALGSRHSFNDLVDSPGVLVSLQGLEREPTLNEEELTVTVSAGTTYGILGPWLHERGFGLAALASLPHISVVGAITTATHGSGDAITTLAGSVLALELLTPRGELRTFERGDALFSGAVVSLGALGIVTEVTLRVEPTYQVSQTVIDGVAFDALVANFDEIFSSATSVSAFLQWREDVSIWRKHRLDAGAVGDLSGIGGTPADGPRHPLPHGDTSACTPQLGEPGPWFARLPHFKLEFTPSAGSELQSEYLIPREHAAAALTALRPIYAELRNLVYVSEIRTMAKDDLWLSGAFGRDTVGIHTTWVQDVDAVTAVLPRIEAALAPFAARPHWGKLFTLAGDELSGLYPHFADAQDLIATCDPQGIHANDYLRRVGLR